MKYFLSITLLAGAITYGTCQSTEDLLQIAKLNNEYVEKMNEISSPMRLDYKSLYLDEQWNHIMIMTKTNEILHSTGRINLVRKAVEILVDRHVRQLNEAKVKALIVNGSRILKVSGSKIEGMNTSSYMGILSTGKLNLLEAHKIGFRVEEHAYSGVVRDETPILLSDFYYTDDFKTYYLLSGKREILSLMEDKRTEVERFIKINKLKLHQKKSLSILFNYYNSLDSSVNP